MGTITKYTKGILAALFICIVYFFTRLVALTNVPIFTDEAIYLRWAQIANQDANWRFISLTDGKQPLFIWLVAITLRFFADPLVAGRLVSVGAGLMTMIGLFFLTKELFKNKWTAIISTGLYAISPFALVYDRLVLYDSLVGTFAVWGLYLMVLLVRYIRLDLAFIAGFVTGAAVLNKTNGFFTIYLAPVALLIFDFKQKEKVKKFMRLGGLYMVVGIMTYLIYAILRLSPFFYLITQKNAIFVHPFSEWIKNPFVSFQSNLQGLSDWFLTYMKLPFILAVPISLWIDRAYLKEKIMLILWFAIPFTAMLFFGNTIYPRYLFFMVLSLLPLIAYTIQKSYIRIRNKGLFILLCFIILLLPILTSAQILINFGNASVSKPQDGLLAYTYALQNSLRVGIPLSDGGQLFTDWPSGAGVKESIAFFREQEKKFGHIFIATEGTFGLMPYAYDVYFANDSHVTVKGIWPIREDVPKEVQLQSQKIPTFFVFYQPCIGCEGKKGLAPMSWMGIKKVMQVQKIVPNAFLTVYQVMPR